jgi:DNA-directed RNA polymerase subunit RPC12/RpoP
MESLSQNKVGRSGEIYRRICSKVQNRTKVEAYWRALGWNREEGQMIHGVAVAAGIVEAHVCCNCKCALVRVNDAGNFVACNRCGFEMMFNGGEVGFPVQFDCQACNSRIISALPIGAAKAMGDCECGDHWELSRDQWFVAICGDCGTKVYSTNMDFPVKCPGNFCGCFVSSCVKQTDEPLQKHSS